MPSALSFTSSPPMRSPTLPPPYNDFEKDNSQTRSSTRKRRGIIFALTFVLFCFLTFPAAANTTASIWAKIKSVTGCSTFTPMSSSTHHATAHSAAQGWHARATRTSSDTFAPKASDLVFTGLINSQVEPDGFTVALVRPNLAVDASGHVLTLSTSDFTAFEAHVRAVSEHVPATGAFMGQWRVKQARTSYPIDQILIPGEKERAVYGWVKGDAELELEEETKGRTTLPKELQVLVGLAKEARDGYVRGRADEAVIGKIRALL